MTENANVQSDPEGLTAAQDLPDGSRATAPSGNRRVFSLDENGKAIMTPDDYQRFFDRILIPENPYLELSDRQARRYERRQARKQAKRDARVAAKPSDPDKPQPAAEIDSGSARYLPDGTRVSDPKEYYQRLLDRMLIPENPYLGLSDRHARRLQRRQARKKAKRDARIAEDAAVAEAPAPGSAGRDNPRPA